VTGAAGQLFDVIILGAGPAGAAAAVGMAAKGFSTAVISRGACAGVQGLSARALVSLTEAALESFVTRASEPATRNVSWSGERSERGQEVLIDRAVFDGHLRACVQSCAVSWVETSVQNIASVGNEWHIETNIGPVRGRTLLDARGRFARRSEERGPLLVSRSIVLQSGRRLAPRSAVTALDDGWCWIAQTQSGAVSAQFVGSATERGWSGEQLAVRIKNATRTLEEFSVPVERLLKEGTHHACAAVARYSQPSRGPGYLRIGDAAVAMDPLSGNGVHEAVRSARVAVAALNSFLLGESWSVVARFIDERARELWRRGVSAAGAFYRSQADWSGSEFWASAATAYERAAERAAIQVVGEGRFEMRPVLNGERIELRRVWVSREWPRGVWTVAGRTLEQQLSAPIPSLLRSAAATPAEV
jgi:flavin-dependent dehydrogenase